MRQKPADECSAAQHNNEVNAVTVADHIGGPRYRFICRAARRLTKISDNFVNDAISALGNFITFARKKAIVSTKSLADAFEGATL